MRLEDWQRYLDEQFVEESPEPPAQVLPAATTAAAPTGALADGYAQSLTGEAGGEVRPSRPNTRESSPVPRYVPSSSRTASFEPYVSDPAPATIFAEPGSHIPEHVDPDIEPVDSVPSGNEMAPRNGRRYTSRSRHARN